MFFFIRLEWLPVWFVSHSDLGKECTNRSFPLFILSSRAINHFRELDQNVNTITLVDNIISVYALVAT